MSTDETWQYRATITVNATGTGDQRRANVVLTMARSTDGREPVPITWEIHPSLAYRPATASRPGGPWSVTHLPSDPSGESSTREYPYFEFAVAEAVDSARTPLVFALPDDM